MRLLKYTTSIPRGVTPNKMRKISAFSDQLVLQLANVQRRRQNATNAESSKSQQHPFEGLSELFMNEGLTLTQAGMCKGVLREKDALLLVGY